MIDYQTFCQIRHLRDEQQLTLTQIARQLGLHWQTVAHWEKRLRYERRQAVPAQRRVSKLAAFKPAIQRLLATHASSVTQLLARLREQGYDGRYTILRSYVRQVRPPRAAAFRTLHFAPGQCAQVDWGSWGSIRVGNTRRRLSFFALVLCHSRQLYVEFMAAASVVSAMADKTAITSERQARELSRVEPERRNEIVEKAVAATGGKITAAAIREAGSVALSARAAGNVESLPKRRG